MALLLLIAALWVGCTLQVAALPCNFSSTEEAVSFCSALPELLGPIERDLEPFKAGITLDLMQKAAHTYTLRGYQKGIVLGFKDGKAYVVDANVTGVKGWLGHHANIFFTYMHVMLELEQLFGRLIPDVEFVICSGDKPQVLKQERALEIYGKPSNEGAATGGELPGNFHYPARAMRELKSAHQHERSLGATQHGNDVRSLAGGGRRLLVTEGQPQTRSGVQPTPDVRRSVGEATHAGAEGLTRPGVKRTGGQRGTIRHRKPRLTDATEVLAKPRHPGGLRPSGIESGQGQGLGGIKSAGPGVMNEGQGVQEPHSRSGGQHGGQHGDAGGRHSEQHHEGGGGPKKGRRGRRRHRRSPPGAMGPGKGRALAADVPHSRHVIAGAGYPPYLGPAVPVFRFCSSPGHADIRQPIFHFYTKHYTSRWLSLAPYINQQYPWADRKEVVFGRFSKYLRHVHPHVKETMRVGANGTQICQQHSKDTTLCVVRQHMFEVASAYPQLMDVHHKGKKPIIAHAKYKYLIHVDGQGLSSRLDQLLPLGSLIFKEESGYTTYYHDLLKPYLHYIPFWKETPLDILDGIAWAKSHDAEAHQIALASQAFAQRYLSKRARTCYWYFLLTRFAKLLTYKPESGGGALGTNWVPIREYFDTVAKVHEGGRRFTEYIEQ